ncbi:MAG: MFS transporter, partial [Anaerolineae bacterium]|jgi:GPH family glycoside/pentoside/hexuronide:cation symporter|nr:MFS transporter [Anaerolineae bacterium]
VLDRGVTAKQWAAVLFIYTFIDALDNPIYGFLSDRTRSRWGRRRPWLAIGTPLLILTFIAFYNIPAFLSGNSIYAYAMLFYILAGTLDSVINANYGALFPELFRDDASRAKTNAMRQAFQLVAMIISIALTPMVTDALGYGLTSVVYGIIGGAVILYMTFTCREREPEPEEARPSFLKALKDLLTNKKFWIAGLANAFYSAAMSLVLASVSFYVQYALGLSSGQSTFLLAAVLVVAIAGVSLWVWLVKKFTLIPVWRGALAVLAITFVPLYFASNLVTAVIFSAFIGLGFAGVITTMDLIGAKIMDEDTRKYGLRREGIISNAMGFMNRLNGLFTSAAYLLVGRLYGFESGTNPGPSPDAAARFLLTIVPPILMVISFAFSWFIDFKNTPPATADLVEA